METVLNVTEKPHSYECGKAGNRHKIYYATTAELKAHLKALEQFGLYMAEPTIHDVE